MTNYYNYKQQKISKGKQLFIEKANGEVAKGIVTKVLSSVFYISILNDDNVVVDEVKYINTFWAYKTRLSANVDGKQAWLSDVSGCFYPVKNMNGRNLREEYRTINVELNASSVK